MTKDQIQNSTMFKVMSKALKQKFPWIESIEVIEQDIDKYETLYPMIIHVDLLKLEEVSQMDLANYVKSNYYFRYSPEGYSSSLMMYLQDNADARAMDDELEAQIEKINNSPAVREFRLPKKLRASMYNAKPLPPEAQ